MSSSFRSNSSNFTLGKIYANPYLRDASAPSGQVPDTKFDSRGLSSVLQSQVSASGNGPGSLLVNISTGGRNVCKAGKQGLNACGGKKIKKKELRVGMAGAKHGGRDWRHWRCLTKDFIDRMKETYPTPNDLPGFLDLSQLHQSRVSKTYYPVDRSKKKKAEGQGPAPVIRRSMRLA